MSHPAGTKLFFLVSAQMTNFLHDMVWYAAQENWEM